jgi:DNA-binding response OmpR family regulator
MAANPIKSSGIENSAEEGADSVDLPVVYIEDDPDDFHCLKTAFDEAGCPNPLLLLEDGEKGQTYFTELLEGKQQWPALVLVDLILPRMPGMDLIRWLRTKPEFKSLPVVAFSGMYDFNQLEAGYDSGANLYVVKPTELSAWTELVHKLKTYWTLHGVPFEKQIHS